MMLGAGEVRQANTEQESLGLIEQHSFDCALLNANLHGRSVEKIAIALRKRSIPFVFVTGYGRSGLPPDFQQMQVLTKPVNDPELVAALTALVSKRSNVIRLKS